MVKIIRVIFVGLFVGVFTGALGIHWSLSWILTVCALVIMDTVIYEIKQNKEKH